MHSAWDMQLPALVERYLQWKHNDIVNPEDEELASCHQFQVVAVDVFGPWHVDFTRWTHRSHHTECYHNHAIRQLPDELANVSLVRVGFLGCSPTMPSVAISFRCLEFYHQLRRRQSSFSIQAYAKVLCALHDVSL